MKLKTLLVYIALSAVPTMAPAQSSPYQAAVVVNGIGVTYHEIDQRTLMLETLGTLGDVEKQARETLIDERLQQQAARQLGVAITEELLKAGMDEFAARANITGEQMTAEFAKEGVDPEAFADFVRAGLIWRSVVSQKFQSKAIVSEAELDAAINLGSTSVGASVLLAELVLPLVEGQDSASPTRADGGKIDWIPIGNLPAEIGTLLLTRGVGAVTPPIPLPNAVAIFRLRGLRDNRTAAAKTIGYDYATFLIPGGRSEAALAQAAKLKQEIDTCKDLAAKVRQLPETLFNRSTLPLRQIPRNFADELAQLDPNEVSTNLTSGQNGENLVFLMLCSRTTALTAGNREEVRNALFSQRMEAFGTGYLQELRGDAIITYK
jgi:peptidyl-prolyl cis-trans isomerase SurA